MKKLFRLILLIMLFPLIASAAIIMGGNTNTSKPYPIVVTNAATVATSTLNGTAYNYNSAGFSYFNYGTSIAYGSQTSQVVFAANTVTTSFSAIPSNLTPGVLYHFQACVSNESGSSCGSDLTFTALGLGTMTRVSSISLGPAISIIALAIDTTNGFLYTCNSGQVGVVPQISKIRLSDFTYINTLNVGVSASTQCNAIAIDISGGFLIAIPSYQGAGGDNVYKVSLSSFTVTTSARIPIPPDTTTSVTIDTNHNIYISVSNLGFYKMNSSLVQGIGYSDTTPGRILYDFINNKILATGTLSTFISSEFDTSFNLLNSSAAMGSTGVSKFGSASLDIVNNNWYVWQGDTAVYKVSLPTLATITVIGTSGQVVDIAVDSGLGYFYYNNASLITNTITSALLSSGVASSTLTLNSGEQVSDGSDAVDLTNHILYLGLKAGLGTVVKVQLN